MPPGPLRAKSYAKSKGDPEAALEIFSIWREDVIRHDEHWESYPVSRSSNRRKRKQPLYRCVRCKHTFDRPMIGGFCPSCLDAKRKARRKKTGQNLLDKATDGGTEVRGGQEFTVKVLPPRKRRGGRWT